MSFKLLAILGAIALLLTLFGQPYYLLLFDLAAIRYNRHWSLSGIRFDVNDIALGCLFCALMIKGRGQERRPVPYFWIWFALGVCMSVSYVLAEDNARSLTSPARVVYQLYRYCWKPILFYPICMTLIQNPKQVRQAFIASIIGANACALMAIQQGYAHLNTVGPFGAKNSMGGFMIIPTVMALVGAIFPTSRKMWFFSCISLVLMARATLFSASRGAMVSLVGGCLLYGAFVFLVPAGRRRILTLAPLGLIAVIGLLVVRPDILGRPAIRHVMTTAEGTSTNTMKWRMEQRWPFFFDKALQRPWFGWGNAVEESFGDAANTPHNGYLTMAVKNGFPVAFIYVFFYYRLVMDALRSFFKYKDSEARVFGIALASGATGVMVHNIIDATLVVPLFAKFFWMLCALAAAHARSSALVPSEDEGSVA